MKSYKEFEQVNLGASDIASLIAVTMEKESIKTGSISFGKDGKYKAYVCFGDDVQIGEHYNKVFEGREWLKIYDDLDLMYVAHSLQGFEHFTIYRAGEMGCIIHWHN